MNDSDKQYFLDALNQQRNAILERASHRFESGGEVNADGVPVRAIILQAVFSLAFLWTASFESILVLAGATMALNTFFAVLGVFVLRWRQPNLPRPYRTWLFPLPPLVFLLITGWTLIYTVRQRPEEAWLCLAVAVTHTLRAKRPTLTRQELLAMLPAALLTTAAFGSWPWIGLALSLACTSPSGEPGPGPGGKADGTGDVACDPDVAWLLETTDAIWTTGGVVTAAEDFGIQDFGELSALQEEQIYAAQVQHGGLDGTEPDAAIWDASDDESYTWARLTVEDEELELVSWVAYETELGVVYAAGTLDPVAEITDGVVYACE